MKTVEEIKKDFPLLENNMITYLDSGATSQKPIQVINRVQEFYERYNANPHRGAYNLSIEATEVYENTRKEIDYTVEKLKASVKELRAKS